ncbi:hypothetical protein KIPB_002651 [Kipferlia bialata]|uniref:RCC1-like domain-containing protein n=1 Tax=Kipferlia bialata TaxID=797122 RepID=A0A9K3GGF2_9EUKA|nr:hypothetical protein KIPB_002651 [Kipferlia bialata]|eukprot:g2651.t1
MPRGGFRGFLVSCLVVCALWGGVCAAGFAATGGNNDGEMGLGDFDERYSLTSLPLSAFGGEAPIDVCNGEQHTVVLTEEGHLYSMGADWHGQLGVAGDCQPKQNVPLLIDPAYFGGNKISSIACGYQHTIVIDQTHTVYGFGDNCDGQLGTKAVWQLSDSPIPVQFDKIAMQGHPIKAAAYGYTTYVLTSEGEVWAFGLNMDCEAGQPGSESGNYMPVQLPTLMDLSVGGSPSGPVMDVVAGYDFVVFLMASGDVLAMGANTYGQLGVGSTYTQTDKAQKVLPFWGSLTPVSLSVGNIHTLAHMDDGSVYCWGSNTYSQCTTKDVPHVTSPIRMNLSAVEGGKVSLVAAGDDMTMVADAASTLYTSGTTMFGSSGIGHYPWTVESVYMTPIDSSALYAEDASATTTLRTGSNWWDTNFVMAVDTHTHVFTDKSGTIDSAFYTEGTSNRWIIAPSAESVSLVCDGISPAGSTLRLYSGVYQPLDGSVSDPTLLGVAGGVIAMDTVQTLSEAQDGTPCLFLDFDTLLANGAGQEFTCTYSTL